MTELNQTVPLEPPALSANDVEVRAPARPGPLAVMRTVAADIAMRADFDVDSIADIRLAVDEVCASLADLAAPDAPVLCRFNVQQHRLVLAAEVDSRKPAGPDTATFSWRVITALVDAVTARMLPSADGTRVVRIEVTKEVHTG